ncbi:MAG: rRNA maturation RNase YbeY [Clostridia bacterium]|nr:rRNA maturation RNase YbeY [Clostridia bacterium]
MTLNTYITDEQSDFQIGVAMKAIVRKAIFNTLVYEGFDRDVEVSVSFVDNDKIKELNKEYRGKNSVTDVLSFPQYDDFDDAFEEQVLPLGDIVVSLERAAEQGYNLFHSIYHEVAFLCVHSTLHLLGYDHEASKEDEKEMIQKQKDIMEIIGF